MKQTIDIKKVNGLKGKMRTGKIIYDPEVAEREIAKARDAATRLNASAITKYEIENRNYRIFSVFFCALVPLVVAIMAYYLFDTTVEFAFGLWAFVVLCAVISCLFSKVDMVTNIGPERVPQDFYTPHEVFCEFWKSDYSHVLMATFDNASCSSVSLEVVDTSGIVHRKTIRLSGVQMLEKVDFGHIEIDLIKKELFLPYSTI